MLTFLLITGLWFLLAGVCTRYRNSREVHRGISSLRQCGAICNRVPILMPVCGRPHYLRQVLVALSQVEDIDKALLVISQDGSDTEVTNLIQCIDFTDVVILRHTRPFLGTVVFFWDSLHAVSTNLRFLLDFAFDRLGAQYAIVLEDDLVPSPDFLRYFSWAHCHLLADPRVLSVTGFNLNSRLDLARGYDPRSHPYTVVENQDQGQPKFTGWSWAIARPMWRRIRRTWSLLDWDIRLDQTQRRLGLISYKPILCRVRNIGMQGGINFTETETNPKWNDILLSEAGPTYQAAPLILVDEPACPSYCDRPAEQPVLNERQRKRSRRLWAGVGLLLATVAEILFFLGDAWIWP